MVLPKDYPGTGRAQPPPQSSSAKRVTANDFKGSSVQKVVLSECVQHPATILPAAGSLVAVATTMMISATPASVGCAVVLAFVSGAAFIWNYVVNGEQRARLRIEQLREIRRRQMVTDFDDLSRASRAANFEEIASKADSLKQSYLNLLQYLQAHAGTSVDGFRFLAEDTLKQGSQTLAQALDMAKAIKAVDVHMLRFEVGALTAELAKIGASSPRARTIQLSIEEHNKRIEVVAKHQDQLSELLLHADEIEAALQQTWLELTALGQQDPTSFLGDDGGAASRLKSAVDAARRVEESLRGNTVADAALRNKYINQTDDKTS